MYQVIEETEGVLNAVSGYTGGNTENPTYQEVTTGKTGHAEAVLVVFNKEIISYSEILDLFQSLENLILLLELAVMNLLQLSAI